MAAYVCHTCAVKWPHTKPYKKCPQCLTYCEYSAGASALGSGEARALANYAKFDRFYDMWCKAAEKRGDPTPEFLGAMEAKAQSQAIKLTLKQIDELEEPE